jgi:hypothetical protein
LTTVASVRFVWTKLERRSDDRKDESIITDASLSALFADPRFYSFIEINYCGEFFRQPDT